MSFLTTIRQEQGISERALAQACGLARETVRSCERNPEHGKFETLDLIARQLNHRVQILIVPIEAASIEYSTVSVSLNTMKDGFDSWKIHFMNLVDEFRRSRDIRLVLLPPVSSLDIRLRGLLAAIVQTLCEEVSLESPDWSRTEVFLNAPWFVSGVESLKATALVESPLPFRRNNIFVQGNFLERA